MELYNYKLKNYANILKREDDMDNRKTGDSPILKEEVEKAARMLKNGKSPRVDNITVTSSELQNNQPGLSP